MIPKNHTQIDLWSPHCYGARHTYQVSNTVPESTGGAVYANLYVLKAVIDRDLVEARLILVRRAGGQARMVFVAHGEPTAEGLWACGLVRL